MKIIPFILLFVAQMSYAHTPADGSNTVMTRSGHQDADTLEQAERLAETDMAAKRTESVNKPSSKTEDKPTPQEATKEDVLFVPNDKILEEQEYRDTNEAKTLGDIVANVDKGIIQIHTEVPRNNDVIFMAGSYNNDPQNEGREQTKNDLIEHTKKIGLVVEDCTNVDCNRTYVPVCGGKKEHGKMRFRLFENECFFRKVNCGFTYSSNRYKVVNNTRCAQILTHKTTKPKTVQHRPAPEPAGLRTTGLNRRSFNQGLSGLQCEHLCPVACQDGYDPECAISLHGVKRVFQNHCLMDMDSCVNDVVWMQRPLTVCIKREQAEMQSNMQLFSWMQRRGFIDSSGRVIKEA